MMLESTNRVIVVEAKNSKKFYELLELQKRKNKDFDNKCKAVFNKLKN
ncbi:hypothetical protein [Priestia aryabhattai]